MINKNIYYASFGSNCEVSMMINRFFNNKLYSHLFNWANIKIDKLNFILNNISIISNLDNYKFIIRLFKHNILFKNIYDKNLLLEDDIKKYDIHIDYEFYHNNEYLFWNHGLQLQKKFKLINYDKYISDIKNKIKHLIEKTLNLLSSNEITFIYLKALKNEYTKECIINFYNSVFRDNIYIGIIYEKNDTYNEEEYNINLKNLTLLPVEKLTPHNAAVHDKQYKTEPNYKLLFNTTKKLYFNFINS
jgi:hypothetical protein